MATIGNPIVINLEGLSLRQRRLQLRFLACRQAERDCGLIRLSTEPVFQPTPCKNQKKTSNSSINRYRELKRRGLAKVDCSANCPGVVVRKCK